MEPDEMALWTETPAADYLIAGWKNQWSDGGNISSGLPAYLIEQLNARKIGQLSSEIERMCYPFQIAGTHDAFRPAAAFYEGLPTVPMHWDNDFYDAGNGLIIFLGEEPWFEPDLYGEAIFAAIRRLGIKQTVTVEGYNGPAPPDLERRVGCVFSRPALKETLELYGIQFSNYGSGTRQGPTVGMALVSMAHYRHPDLSVFRLGAMAPMYPFSTSGNRQVGIVTDYRAFFDIMRRLKAMFRLSLPVRFGKPGQRRIGPLAGNPGTHQQFQFQRPGNYRPGARRLPLYPLCGTGRTAAAAGSGLGRHPARGLRTGLKTGLLFPYAETLTLNLWRNSPCA